jgi:hypothetical protein
MNFAAIQGLVNGTEQVVFDYTVTGSAVSSIPTGNILNGDEDGWYTIIGRVTTGTSDQGMMIQPNGDATAGNYGGRNIRVIDTTVASETGANFASFGTTGAVAFFVARLYAKSGAVRLFNVYRLGYASGTTINRIHSGAVVWNNTSDVIRSFTFKPDQANGLGVGSRIIVLKSNNFTVGQPMGNITTPYIKGAWVRVGSSVLSAPASSVPFYGLDGNRDVVYLWKISSKSGLNCKLNPNGLTTGIGFQRFYMQNTTIGGSRGTDTNFETGYADDNQESVGEGILFAPTGLIRTALNIYASEMTGTTVTTLYARGHVLSNTTDNITSMIFNATTKNFAAGSVFELYALRPNG